MAERPIDILGVGDVARQLGVAPKRITELFYTRCVNPERAPIVAGRRLIPRSLIPIIAAQLRRKGVCVREVDCGV